jgi:iron(III) transport system ATP-binding protein
LSGGQQQRVALARALVVEPETLLLDEPLSNLDANLREEMRFEIRRLHDEYRYTTVYVTHDQSEAMTTADLIAVMNAGRIDQLGTPEDIYERPQSEFVARFIGSSNVINGTARDENHISFSGATLQVVGAKLQAGQSAVVAIRQHDIQLSVTAPPTSDNAVKATVTRQVFLGANRDYMVETSDGTVLRIITSTETAVPRGTEVWLTLPTERCRALGR